LPLVAGSESVLCQNTPNLSRRYIKKVGKMSENIYVITGRFTRIKMARGAYPRLITNRKRIYQLTGRYIPLTRTRKDGTEYVITPKPYCSKCRKPVRKLYQINPHYRTEIDPATGDYIPRYEHVAYRCPSCDSLFSRKIVSKLVEQFGGDG